MTKNLLFFSIKRTLIMALFVTGVLCFNSTKLSAQESLVTNANDLAPWMTWTNQVPVNDGGGIIGYTLVGGCNHKATSFIGKYRVGSGLCSRPNAITIEVDMANVIVGGNVDIFLGNDLEGQYIRFEYH